MTTPLFFPIIDIKKSHAPMKARSQQDLMAAPKLQQTQIKASFSELTNKIKRSAQDGNNSTMIQFTPTPSMAASKKNVVRDMTQKLHQHKTEIQQKQQLVEDLESNLEFIRSEYMREKGLSEEKNKVILDLQESYNKLVALQEILNAKLKFSQAKIEELNTKCQKQEKELMQHQQQSCQTQFNSIDLDGTFEEYKQQKHQIDHLQEQLKNKEEQLVSQHKEITANKQLIQQLQKLNNTLQNEIKCMNSENKSTNQSTKGLEQRVEQLVQQLSNANAELDQKGGELNIKIKENLILDKNNNELNSLNQLLQEKVNLYQQQMVEHGKQDSESKQLAEVISQHKIQFDLLHSQFQQKCSELIQKTQEFNLSTQQFNLQLQEKDQLISELKKKQQEAEQLRINLSEEVVILKKALEDVNNILSKEKYKEQQVSFSLDKLQQAEKEIVKNLKCHYCNALIKEPVTIIPCGHIYCLNCKKGYTKECIKCGPKVKLEAAYRNELLDDLLNLLKLIQNLYDNLLSIKPNNYLQQQ